MVESKMTCRAFIKLFEADFPLSITEALSVYEISLVWQTKACVITDSDTFEKIMIIDPEHLNVKY
ncbi:MAG: hypothetical protein BWY02_02787 [bacterium ADurb.Bin157]|nr:MAG: hypothetical protein BWY02_02787 [bacterium ADurb.Bin157]